MLPLSDTDLPSSSKGIGNSSEKKDILDAADHSDGTMNSTSGTDFVPEQLSINQDRGHPNNGAQQASNPIVVSSSDFSSDPSPLCYDDINLPSSFGLLGDSDYSFNSILNQFDTFFRQKLDSEIENFQNFMHAMLTEQQIHIQQILNTVSVPSSSQELSPENADEDLSVEIMTQGNDQSSSYCCQCQSSESKARMALMMELLTLSCQVTALLGQPKFTS